MGADAVAFWQMVAACSHFVARSGMESMVLDKSAIMSTNLSEVINVSGRALMSSVFFRTMVNVARNLVLRSSKFLATFSIVLFRAFAKLINSSCVADVARDGRLANSERAMLRCSVGSSDNVGEFCGSRAGVLAGDELIVQSVSDVAEGVDGVRVQPVCRW